MNADGLLNKYGLGIMAVLCIVASLAAMAYSIYRVQDATLQKEREQMLLVARSTAKSAENYLSGCLTGVNLTSNSPGFAEAVRRYDETGREDRLMPYLATLASEEHPAVADVFFTDAAGKPIFSTSAAGAYENIGPESGDPGDGRFRVFRRTADGAMFLGFATPGERKHYLVCLIDVERLYHNSASFADLGGMGYVMFKHSGGIILSHRAPEQVGLDVLAGRSEKFPDLDYTDLERLVANQEQGKEGLEVYHSYWWTEDPPPRVKKISAYTPIHVQNDFIILSAVTDYTELLRPVQASSAAIVAAAFLAFLGFITLLLCYRRESQRKIKEKNEYLRQLNKSLDEMARHQEEMRHDQRLQLIGTLTGGIAHEFRNLLTPIMGYSGLLRESLPPESPIREDVEEIYGSAVKAKEIIQQVMSLSRKSDKPEFKPVTLAEAVRGILKVANASKPADFEIHNYLDGNQRIMANRTQLSQVVLNLCQNAFQAKRAGVGHLWIRGWTEEENGDAFAVLRFTDDGSGIQPEALARIFDPFFTTKRVGEGTGLGLSVVQSIVELHGGTIEAQSEFGGGSVFTLRFPLVAPEGREPANGETEEQPDITLVEAEDNTRLYLETELRKKGFAVRAFTRPEDAAADLASRPCRLLLAARTLSGMSGIDLARRVREKTPFTKIIILTRDANQELIDCLQSNVIDGYQIKPVQLPDILEKITALYG